MLNVTFCISLVILLAKLNLGCDEHLRDEEHERQDYGYYANDWNEWNPYYYSRPRVPQHQSNFYDGRSSAQKYPSVAASPYNYFSRSFYDINRQSDNVEGRLALPNMGSSFLNNVFSNNRYPAATASPFSLPLFTGLTSGNSIPIMFNPNYVWPFSSVESCTTSSGDSGTCSSATSCSRSGGRPSGFCSFGRICCINTVMNCGSTVTLNNTYWQSPTSTSMTTPTSCTLTLQTNTQSTGQSQPICQVRLDFLTFNIAQPASSTVCSTDTFQVSGASSVVPTICGENTGQHMYIEVPPTPSSLQFLFNFGATSSTARSWNIKIALLPCGASYLAPSGCLQYFTSSAGRVSSFNWKDVPVTGADTRQLANQNYNICFRTEIVNSQRAKQICATVCTPTNGGDGYALTGFDAKSSINNTDCANDFLIIVGAKDSTVTVNPAQADRFCGGNLNPATVSVSSSVPVCTTMAPFRITYVTDGTELARVPVDTTLTATNGESNNVGFCLNYQQN